MRDYSRLAAGFLIGAVGMTAGLATRAGGAAGPAPGPPMDVLHTPPFLTTAGGGSVPLRYGIVCAAVPPEPPEPCRPSGTVYVRSRTSKEFDAVRPSRVDGRLLEFRVPGTDLEYHAVFTDGRGHSTRLPETAEHRLWTVGNWASVELGAHVFGRTRRPDRVVGEARWGVGGVGLDAGPEQARIGPSAFDVAADGSVVVLDQVHRRLLVLDGEERRSLPIDFRGGEGDLALGPDGTAWVLDDGGTRTSAPFVRGYSPAGVLRSSSQLREPVADMLRVGPDGPVVHGYPSELWLRAGGGDGSAGRPTGRAEIVVSASRHEARFALVVGGRVAGAWRVRSDTNLGEVQLAEPVGGGLLVVLRVWTESAAEFQVLRLNAERAVESFSVAPAEWAEAASLSRFRLRGTTLYQLRSSRHGLRIVSFELGGAA